MSFQPLHQLSTQAALLPRSLHEKLLQAAVPALCQPVLLPDGFLTLCTPRPAGNASEQPSPAEQLLSCSLNVFRISMSVSGNEAFEIGLQCFACVDIHSCDDTVQILLVPLCQAEGSRD